jgi:ATP-binding cassette subfamily C protein
MFSTSRQRPATAALLACTRRFGAIAFFSGIVNLLMLNGSLYMLQVYDRVMVSRSLPTLISVTLLLVFLFGVLAVTDVVRQRLLVTVGREVEARLRAPAHAAMIRLAVGGDRSRQPMADLDSLRGFLSGTGPAAFLDLPWVPVFLAFSFLIHPAIGLLSVGGATVMISLTLAAERLTRGPSGTASKLKLARRLAAETERRHAEAIAAMGIGPALRARHDAGGRDEAAALARAANFTSGFASVSRVIRLLIQSLLLGLGAYLVIKGDATGGASIASSIMVGRCLAPIDTVIAQWRGAIEARAAWRRLDASLETAAATTVTALPLPQASLAV